MIKLGHCTCVRVIEIPTKFTFEGVHFAALRVIRTFLMHGVEHIYKVVQI